jgi:hypothetical protein
MFKALLLASTLLTGGLMAGPANAAPSTYPAVVTTTGTITSGSETGGLFGLPVGTTSLVGDSYTLSVSYDYLGSGYSAVPGGIFASDFEISPGVPGVVTATVNGNSVTTSLSSPFGSTLIEDLFDLTASTNGTDAAGDFVTVSQSLSCVSACVPYADLLTPFFYALLPGDVGADSYTYEAAGFPAPGTPTATFSGTETSMSFQVPEPASWGLLTTGLLGLGLLVRRRRA